MSPCLELTQIGFVRDGCTILEEINLVVQPQQRWLILGANGSGKTSLVRIAALYEHPTRGTVSVLGQTLGTTDVRTLRQRIGYVSASLANDLRPALAVSDVVMTAKYAALETWWHDYNQSDHLQATNCLARLGVSHLHERPFGSLSSGEQQRVLLARSLMNNPGIVLLDEPSARLDLGGREQLVAALSELTHTAQSPPLVLVTHHVDEIPLGMTHTLILKAGRVLTSGPIQSTFTSEVLSECFDVRIKLEQRANGRYTAWAIN